MGDASIILPTEYAKPNYDIWLIWAHGMFSCNFRCIFCINQPSVHDPQANFYTRQRFSRKILPITPGKPSPWIIKVIEPIQTEQLLQTLAMHKKTFRITFATGEPFMIPGFVESCQQITAAGHHLGFNTNLSCDTVLRLLQTVDPKKIDYFAVSLHFWEVERLKKERAFIRNYRALKERSIVTAVSVVAHPLLLPDLPRYVRSYSRQGIQISFIPFCGYFNGKKYPDAYTPKERQTFSLGSQNGSPAPKNTYCNAGYNVVFADFKGDVFSCVTRENQPEHRLGHVYSGFTLKPDVIKCNETFCSCPYTEYDRGQYYRALQETGKLSLTEK